MASSAERPQRRSPASGLLNTHAGPVLFAALGGVLASGCTVPLATNLDESDANRIVVALDAHGMAAEKTPDVGTDGKWRVQVARDDSSAATTILTAEGLPRKPSRGVLEALGDTSLVPSRAAEHARLLMGTAAELERSLTDMDGVLSARVHLAVPSPELLPPEAASPHASASVLLRHRGRHLPVSDDDVRRLVAGAVLGLSPADIVVVSTPAPESPSKDGHRLRRFGPITVTQASLSWLRLSVGAVAVVNIALVALILSLWSRVRRARGSSA